MPALAARDGREVHRKLQRAPPTYGRLRNRDSWLTKKTLDSYTTLQMWWAIVHIYMLEGVHVWTAVARRFRELFLGPAGR
jgi:hypothetical protein